MSTLELLVVACALATYVWRGLGAAISGRVRAEGPLFTWLGCVAYAMLAGLVARIIVMPHGALEVTELWQRLGGAAVALAVYFLLTRKNLFVGVIAGGAAIVALYGV
ncbi:MAG: AzlD domain-containing protein [Burkholderiales bacterium]|nr:AzlD domain-containing protein [Burkholderiales bacterium]